MEIRPSAPTIRFALHVCPSRFSSALRLQSLQLPNGKPTQTSSVVPISAVPSPVRRSRPLSTCRYPRPAFGAFHSALSPFRSLRGFFARTTRRFLRERDPVVGREVITDACCRLYAPPALQYLPIDVYTLFFFFFATSLCFPHHLNLKPIKPQCVRVHQTLCCRHILSDETAHPAVGPPPLLCSLS
jgi:hypothetical protein